MKRGVAVVVSVLALAACGGPLEEEDPAVAQQQQAMVDLMPAGSTKQVARERSTPADWVHGTSAPRVEDRFYAPWPK